MQRIIVLFIFFISIILYYIAPNYVDKGYCAICLAFYLVEVYIVLRIDLKSRLYAGFNTLFFLSFFLTSFAYPLFVYDTPADLVSMVDRNINFSYLTKCSALCLIASSIYCCGYLYALRINKCEGYNNRLLKADVKDCNYGILKGIFFCVFIILFSFAFLFVQAGGSVSLKGGDLLAALFETIFPIVLLINTVRIKPNSFTDFIRGNYITLSLCILMMLLFIRIGDRGLILTCGLQIIIIYSICVKRIKIYNILAVVLVGFILMFSIRQLRMSDNYSGEANVSTFSNFATSSLSYYGTEYGVWFYLSDLTNISHELCLGYEYSQRHGLFHPVEEIILTLLSPAPLLPSLFSDYVLGHPTSYYVTGTELNKYMSIYGDAHYGNHCVIDVYMMWGLLGVIIVFWGFGYCVAKCYNRTFDNILFAALYVMLVSYSIYVPRNIVLSLIRPAVYIWFFIWLAQVQQKRKLHLKR